VGSRLYDEEPNVFCKSTFLTIQPLGDSLLTIDQNCITETEEHDFVESMLAKQILKCFKGHLDHHSERPHLSFSEWLFSLSVVKEKDQH